MNDDYMAQDGTSEYEAQFQKNMATIAACQAKAEIDMEDLHTILNKVAVEHDKTKMLLQEVAEEQKKTDRLMRKHETNWGRLVESLVEGSLVELLNERGIEVHSTHPRQTVCYLQADGTRKYREFDIVVANGEEVVAVEVKTTLKPKHVKRFIETMNDFSRYFPHLETKRVYGAVAYIRCESGADRNAYKKGLYVIRATGDSASILNDRKFKPKSFTDVATRPPAVHLRAVPDC